MEVDDHDPHGLDHVAGDGIHSHAPSEKGHERRHRLEVGAGRRDERPEQGGTAESEASPPDRFEIRDLLSYQRSEPSDELGLIHVSGFLVSVCGMSKSSGLRRIMYA